MRKGITPIIATTLLILITIVTAALAFLWITSVQVRLEESTRIGGISCSSIRLISMRGNEIVVQNTGCDTLNNITLLIDGILTDYDLSAPLAPGDSGIISFSSLTANREHCIKLVLRSGSVTQQCSSANHNTEDAGYGESVIPPGPEGCVFENESSCSGEVWFNGKYVNFSYNDYGPYSGAVEKFRAADINSDCDLDLVSVSGTNIVLWNNNGAGSFTSQSIASVNHNYQVAFALGDVNNDNRIDIVAVDSENFMTPGSLWVFTQNSGGTFDSHELTGITSCIVRNSAIAISDFNGDGFNDIVYACDYSGSFNEAFVLINDGTGLDYTSTAYSTGGAGYDINLADLNADGAIDIVISTSGSVDVLLNDGTGLFSNVWSCYGCKSLKIADINGDASPDFITGYYSGGGSGTATVRTYINDGTGTDFEQHDFETKCCSEYTIYSTGDFDNDGDIDFSSDTGIHFNDGTGNFSLASFDGAGGVAGDFDKDGDLDLAAEYGNYVRVWFNQAISGENGACCGDSLTENFTNTTSQCVNGVASFFEGDASESNCNLQRSYVEGNPWFGAYSDTAWLTGEIFGDFGPCCGDDGGSENFYNSTMYCTFGKTYEVPLILAPTPKQDCESNSFVWFTGNSSFGPAVISSKSTFFYNMVSGDFDNDGNLDIAASDSSILYVYPGFGNGTFGEALSSTNLVYFGKFITVDLNNDFNLDLLVLNAAPSYWVVSYLQGNGDGTFQTPVDYLTGDSPTQIVLGDFNYDGTWDIVTLDGGGLSYLENYGNATFKPMVQISFPDGSGADIKAANLDGDLYYDLLVTGTSGVWFYKGYGNGSFYEPVIISSLIRGNIAVGNLNGFYFDPAAHGDPNLDLAGGNNYYSLGNGKGELGYAMFNGQLKDEPVIIEQNYYSNYDINYDDITDIISRDNTHIYVLNGDGRGKFVEASSIPDAGSLFLVNDFDADGFLDIASNDNSGITFYDNVGIVGTGGPCCEVGAYFSNATNTCTNGVFS
ncbi:Repeat domain in Vibrio, Colwellia, Bradyrhizobium and Shewanella [uncultured archaeon]|nr:Repeat domain in Vibrio, Colwellia, Bradyrhizobium and Shewanella [uncultured archaeon]